ncbi:MAG: hypothetical protein ACE5DN_06980, partial [Flavobacteriales bacterium]
MLIYFAMAPMFAYAQSSDNAVGKVANKDQTFGYTKMEMPSAKQQLSTQEQDVQTGFSFYNRGVRLIEGQNKEGGTIQVNKLSKAS